MIRFAKSLCSAGAVLALVASAGCGEPPAQSQVSIVSALSAGDSARMHDGHRPARGETYHQRMVIRFGAD